MTPGATFRSVTLDWHHGNVAEVWHRMGAPLNPTPAQVADLGRAADDPRTGTLSATEDGTLEIDLDLAPWAVTSTVEDAAAAGG